MHSPEEIEKAIFALLADRRPEATICPSEVARRIALQGDWRSLMKPIREVAQQLAKDGRLIVTRSSAPVSATSSGGPIRVGTPSTKPTNET